jgi:hypothetical protein
MFDFVAKPSPWRLALLLLACVVFVLGGAWMLGWIGTPPPDAPRWIGWASVGFFGLAGAVIAVRLFDSDDVLRVGPRGIWFRHHSDDLIPWSEVAEIGVWEHRGQKVIVLGLHNPERFPARGIAGMLAGANRAMTGGDVAISLNGTDRNFAEAMAAMKRHGGA